MPEGNILPDTPYRIGTSGKYKLLIKSVTKKYSGYEYELIDAEGKEYKALSGYHYADNQILRCIVSFEIVNARLVVSDTMICKKQDLATLIPEVKKPEPQPKPETPIKPSVTKTVTKAFTHLGDPRRRRVSGLYILRVVEVEHVKHFYNYLVEDAKGQRYKAQSEKQYPVGKNVSCYMSVSLSPAGILKICVTSMGKPAVAMATPKVKNYHKKHHSNSGYSRSSWPEPATGDHFHLIYTPMGNKR